VPSDPLLRQQVHGEVGVFRAAAIALTSTAGQNDNLNIGANTIVKITNATGAFSITGFTAPRDGRIIVVHNTTAKAMTLKNKTGSVVYQQIDTLTGGNVVLAASVAVAMFYYDTLSAKWILLQARDSGGSH
jgi:hypothetical protein